MAGWVLHVCGSASEAVALAPIWKAIARRGELGQRLFHLGPGAPELSDACALLGLPPPPAATATSPATELERLASMMLALEKALSGARPDLIAVAGDALSALASALVAAKRGFALAHLGAGRRSFDRAMPEELHRVVVDWLAELLLTVDDAAAANLRAEGVGSARIRRCGDPATDTLRAQLEAARARPILDALGLTPFGYAICTARHPASIDHPEVLSQIVAALAQVQNALPVVLPLEPGMRRALERLLPASAMPRLIRIPPPGYLDHLALSGQARLILTDDAALQDEATSLGIPGLDLDPARMVSETRAVLEGRLAPRALPQDWDGHAGERIALAFERWMRERSLSTDRRSPSPRVPVTPAFERA